MHTSQHATDAPDATRRQRRVLPSRTLSCACRKIEQTIKVNLRPADAGSTGAELAMLIIEALN